MSYEQVVPSFFFPLFSVNNSPEFKECLKHRLQLFCTFSPFSFNFLVLWYKQSIHSFFWVLLLQKTLADILRLNIFKYIWSLIKIEERKSIWGWMFKRRNASYKVCLIWNLLSYINIFHFTNEFSRRFLKIVASWVYYRLLTIWHR